MDWYYGSGVGVNDYLIPRDQDLLDRHPSPDYWSNWEISANEGILYLKICHVLMLKTYTNPSTFHQKTSASVHLAHCRKKPQILSMFQATQVQRIVQLESMDDGMHEQSSLEEFILKDLEMVIGQFTERTRLCFRDALYRLARNTEQHHEMLDQNEDLNILKPMPHRHHNDITRCQDKKSMELATNNIDRIIASLMFKSMEFNIHDPALTPSATSSESLNKEEKSCYSYPQELLTNAQIPRFGPSNQLRDMGSYTTCEDPVKESFMLGFEMCDSDHYNRL